LNNITIAKDYIVQAEERIYHAKNAMKRGSYAYVVRQSQEATELALKASLRLIGIEFPKIHDVGAILKQHKHKYPQWFQEIIPRLAKISRKLRREREPSMYGDEESGIPPSALYGEKEAKDALKNASYVLNNVKKLFEEYLKNNKNV
jgi:HEPN domain-containing protein